LAQVKIYGLRESLAPVRRQLSDTIHACVVETLGLPPEKRFHRYGSSLCLLSRYRLRSGT